MPLPTETQRRRLVHAAKRAAVDTGAFVRRRFRPTPTAALRKGEGDFVTEVDLAAERALQRRLLDQFPEHGFIGEELAPIRPDAEFVWVVDPIDGTSNFAQGLPIFAVSIACLWRRAPIVAAVYCAQEDALYAATRGLGATRGGRRLRTPRITRLDDASVIGAQWHRGDRAELQFVASCIATGARIRVLGCTVQQLCDVATGRLHANVQQQGRLWDFAAAGLIVTEAGGVLSGWDGAPLFPVDDPCADRHYPSLACGSRAVQRDLLGRAPFGLSANSR